MVSKRGELDLQLETLFLCTRVREAIEYDYEKLKNQMMYLQATGFLPLFLKADGKGTRLYIDGAHAVHTDMKGHGGVYVTMGTGTVSSTKSEIIVVSLGFPACTFLRTSPTTALLLFRPTIRHCSLLGRFLWSP